MAPIHGIKGLKCRERPADGAAAEGATLRGGSNRCLAVFRFVCKPLGSAELLRDSKIDQFLFDLNDSMDFVIYPDPSLIGTYGLLNAHGIFSIPNISFNLETTCNSKAILSPPPFPLSLCNMCLKGAEIKFAA